MVLFIKDFCEVKSKDVFSGTTNQVLVLIRLIEIKYKSKSYHIFIRDFKTIYSIDTFKFRQIFLIFNKLKSN